MKWKWFIIATLVAIPVVASSYWALTCPCDGTPGLYLRGAEVTAPVTDWSIANQVPLCQVQVSRRILPHALNLNCWSSGGELYLGCSGCEEKSWGKTAVANNRAKVRVDQTVYPVTLTRIVGDNELDRVWQARSVKLRGPQANAGRPDGWWAFRAVSR